MQELITAIESLQEDQKKQGYLLENYLGVKNYKEAATQQAFIDGIGRAIFLLMARVSYNNAHKAEQVPPSNVEVK